MNPTLIPASITSGPDMIVIMVIALIVFGPRKLPEIGRQIGMAMRELNKMRSDMQRAFNIDELTNFDSTPSYHPAPYGTTYPANGDVSHSIDAYHPSMPETVYHDDPIHDGANSGLLESVSVSDSPTLNGASVAATTLESSPVAPPPGSPPSAWHPRGKSGDGSGSCVYTPCGGISGTIAYKVLMFERAESTPSKELKT